MPVIQFPHPTGRLLSWSERRTRRSRPATQIASTLAKSSYIRITDPAKMNQLLVLMPPEEIKDGLWFVDDCVQDQIPFVVRCSLTPVVRDVKQESALLLGTEVGPQRSSGDVPVG